MNPKKREKQTRYLSQALQLEEAVNPHIIVATMAMISLAVVIFIVWAAFTNINEVARAPGEVVPYGYQQTVQHLEGGIIKSIKVREGDVVEAAEVLLVLDDASVREDLERAQSKQLSLELQAERLRAFTERRKPDFSRFPGVTKATISDQISFFDGMRIAREKEEQIIRNQISQKKQAVNSIDADLRTARQNRAITEEIYQRRLTLNRDGYMPDLQVLETEKQLNELKGQVGFLENQQVVALDEIREFEARLESLEATQRDEAHQKLDQTLAEMDQNAKIVAKLKERIRRMEIRAPVRGLVKGLAVNTIGSVVQPGQTIMEIVPMDRPLEVQVRIAPKDIGHLAAGQTVQVKFSAFDFSRYGSTRGTLERISATTFTADNGDRYYEGYVILDTNHVGKDTVNLVMPGMTVMVDVVTGEKTILQYLLRPVQVAAQTAFTER